MPYCGRELKNLYDRVWAVIFALAGFAVLAHPYVVELLHGLLDDLWNIGQDARLKVTLILLFMPMPAPVRLALPI